jgi:plasmid stability protein
MRNVTISLDEDLARWVRIRAAEQDKSISRFISETLQRDMLEEKSYDEAMNRFFSREPTSINESGVYPKRDELYDRTGLR